MRILVIAHTVAADEIGLILHRTGSCENLPGILTTLGPVRHGNDGIVGQGVRITAPDGETQGCGNRSIPRWNGTNRADSNGLRDRK